MYRNGMRPVHPGEILREDYLHALGMSANALAKALNVPAPRINDIVREHRGVSAVADGNFHGGAAADVLRAGCAADLAGHVVEAGPGR